MWSLGCVLYELCALKLAFPADNFMHLVQSICRGSYTPISKKHYSSKVAATKLMEGGKAFLHSLYQRDYLQTSTISFYLNQ